MAGRAAKEIYQMLRSRAREAALQVLYQDDLNPQVSPVVGESLLGERFPMSELAEEARAQAMEFSRNLVAGVRGNRQQLDERIARAAEHWSLDRMAATDRNVLRIGAYELLYTDTPPRVAIDEAVELAKRFGSGQSGPFVNGILDKLMHEK